MNALSARSILVVAALQAATALAALASSPTAAIAAAAIGALAIGRYAAVALFASSLCPSAAARPSPRALFRLLSASAWILGLAALLAGVAAVALRAPNALPWAVAAAFAGPLGMTALALGSGLAAVAGPAGGRR
jgi:hypothetical protein